jgi:hypothetical protein
MNKWHNGLGFSGGKGFRVTARVLSPSAATRLCTPGMGENSWGESPLKENQRPNDQHDDPSDDNF